MLIAYATGRAHRSYDDGGWSALASALLALVFGTSLGNIVRGVPLDPEGLAMDRIARLVRECRDRDVIETNSAGEQVWTYWLDLDHARTYPRRSLRGFLAS